MHLEKQTIVKFFEDAGFDIDDMVVNQFYPLTEDWEILSKDASGSNVWKKVTHVVRKESTVPIRVSAGGQEFYVSPEHKFFVRIGDVESWVEAVDLLEEKNFTVYHESGEWIAANFSAGSEEIEILDMSVDETESYYSNGILSHNTLYGDPMTTSGGNAIPYHASVRIKLGAGSPILNKAKETIGINVSAKTIKNKVSAPFRTCNFEIHFGKGIIEDEQVFDILRQHGSETLDSGEIVEVGGDGAWKQLLVSNSKNGEVLIEKKFHKAEFGSIWRDPQYAKYIDDLLDRCMVKQITDSAPADFDENSYEEVRAVAMEMQDDIGPEGP